MARFREKSATGKIFENILFLAEVFGDKSGGEIPNVPVIELARCFELKSARPQASQPSSTQTWVTVALDKGAGWDHPCR